MYRPDLAAVVLGHSPPKRRPQSITLHEVQNEGNPVKNSGVAVPALAQPTVKDGVAKHWKTSGGFTVAVAEGARPAEVYYFESR